MSHKEDESNKVPCPVCGKMVSKTMGRAVHEKSKFHQEALKRQQEGGAEPETKPPVVKEEPETKPPVSSGIAGKGTPAEKKEKKSGGGIGKFLEDLFGDDEDDDW